MPCPQRGKGTVSCPLVPIRTDCVVPNPVSGLLVLDVLTDHLEIQSDCINTVNFGPKMAAPIGTLLQFFELIEYTDR